MSDLSQAFEAARLDGRAAFIPYLTGGDPDLATSERLLRAMARGGADIIEVGVPFSDPIADGPVNQRAATRAIESGASMSGVLRLVARLRGDLAVPVVLFTYFNPILCRGIERFAEQAASSGVDGVLCVDLPPEEGEKELAPALRDRDIDPVYLLAPTSTRERVRRVSEASRGFVYYVSRTGVTGIRDRLPKRLLKEARKLRRKVDPPLAVGFGISTPEQVAEVARVADGVVVGSALVRIVEENAGAADLENLIEERVRGLRAALD
jgi:tryptophan synthase alpha chain